MNLSILLALGLAALVAAHSHVADLEKERLDSIDDIGRSKRSYGNGNTPDSVLRDAIENLESEQALATDLVLFATKYLKPMTKSVLGYHAKQSGCRFQRRSRSGIDDVEDDELTHEEFMKGDEGDTADDVGVDNGQTYNYDDDNVKNKRNINDEFNGAADFDGDTGASETESRRRRRFRWRKLGNFFKKYVSKAVLAYLAYKRRQRTYTSEFSELSEQFEEEEIIREYGGSTNPQEGWGRFIFKVLKRPAKRLVIHLIKKYRLKCSRTEGSGTEGSVHFEEFGDLPRVLQNMNFPGDF